MKRIIALALVLAALLGLTARAESKASIVRLSDIKLSYVGEKGSHSARFPNAKLSLALGDTNGIPTGQLSFENGEGQAVDAVARLEGQQILFSVGGITGVYVLDLNTFASADNSAENIANGLAKMLPLAASHLDVVLYALTTDDGTGMRSVEAPLPMPQLISAAESLMSVTSDMEATQDIDMEGLYERVENTGDGAVLSLRYQPNTGAFELAAIQGREGMRLSGTMQLSVEPMTFARMNEDEGRLDVTNLSPEALERLRGELNIVLMKVMNYADGTGLEKILN